MRRRDLLSLIAASLAAPGAARAQAMPVIGFLGFASGGEDENLTAIRQGLAETGFVEGRSVTVEYRWAEGDLNRFPSLAADVVGRNVDVIIILGGLPGARAVQKATSAIPIVFLVGVDPVATGLVSNLARPDGNLTGATVFGSELVRKRLELLIELVSPVQVIAFLVNPRNPSFPKTSKDISEATQEMARAKGARIEIVSAGVESDLEAAFANLARLQAGALLVGVDSLFYVQRHRLMALAARYAAPTMHFARDYAAAGGLISYGVEALPLYRQVGIYAGRILNGAKPADLPVQQPTKFELVINLKTAKALGLSVPQALLARADEVIE
jgi:putative ABC transport system substrate-binding protein